MDNSPEKYRIENLNSGEAYDCLAGVSLLVGMERASCEGIEVGCRGGGCGVCKVKIVTGEFSAKRMSKAHIDETDREQGRVLACRIYPQSDMQIETEWAQLPAADTEQ